MIVDYRAEWASSFDEERTRLEAVFAGCGARVEHVGSTSVPGLAAKPIIDIAVGLPDLALAEERVDALRDLGYEYVPEYEVELPDRRYFRRPSSRPRTHHLHCLLLGGVRWARHLRFRDALMGSPELARAYGDLKRDLAARYANDRPGYTMAKGPFIERVLASLSAAVSVLAALGAGAAPAPLHAQTPGTRVGVVAGRLSNEQVWQPAAEVEEVGGLVLGGFFLVPTPKAWLSVRAEGTVRQRGGNVTGSASGEAFGGAVRTDYLSVSLQPRFSLGLSRVALFLNAGPGIDQVLRSRVGPALGPIVQERATVFGVGAGAGIALEVTARLHVEAEARLFEGLGDAYRGSFVSFRNRSLELVLAGSIPLRR